MDARQPKPRVFRAAAAAIVGFAMACGILILFSGLALPVTAAPLWATNVNTDIMVHTTWFYTGSPYIVLTNTVSVLNGAVLTIEPGVEVQFLSGAQLQIPNGRLQAIGTATRPITFTAQITKERGSWEGIIFGTNAGTSTIQYATIEYARSAVQINNAGIAPIDVYSSIIRYVGDDDGNLSSGGAIVGDPDNSRFSYNQIYSSEVGIRLSKAGTNWILGNQIHDIEGYCVAILPSPGLNSESNFIDGNYIYNCQNNGIRLIGIGSANKASDNIVTNNVISNTYSEAIYAADQEWNGLGIGNNLIFNTALTTSIGTAGTGSNLAAIALIAPRNPSLYGNQIYDNGASGGTYQGAIYITDTNGFAVNIQANLILDDQGSGIVYDGLLPAPPLQWIQENAICVEGGGYEFENRGVGLDAEGNWWSTNLPVFGAEIIGTLDITPWIVLSATVAPPVLPADGLSTSVITVTMNDGSGHTVPIPARTISLDTSLGTLSAVTVTLDSNGVATATLTAPTSLGTAIVTATELCGYPVTATIQFETADAGIAKSSIITQVIPGNLITYTIPFSNDADVAATNVVITDDLPTGTVWQSDNAADFGFTRALTTPDVVWTHPSLAPHASGTIVLTVQVQSSAGCNLPLTNSVVITAATEDGNPGNNSATHSGIQTICADVAISKAGPGGSVAPGETITYTITYSNIGQARAENVVITDVSPITGGIVTLPGVSSLNPGELQTLQYAVTADSSICGLNYLTNTAYIGTSTPEVTTTNNVAISTDPPQVTCYNLAITKTSHVAWAVPGQAVTYTIEYSNTSDYA
ncbi:MAG: DUF11 domain-containing protein, partial [Anaerolineales bacterium]